MMRKRAFTIRFIGIFFAILMVTISSITELDTPSVGPTTSPGKEALNGFVLAVGDYYRIPQREVIIIKERGIPPREIPVVLLIAKKAHVAPEIVADFRLRGNTWLDTTFRFDLGPEIFYVRVGLVIRDPLYGNVYLRYTHKPKKEWSRIALSDDDIINLVNLKLMSEHYGYPFETIIRMRSSGQQFDSIDDEIRREKDKTKGNDLVETKSK